MPEMDVTGVESADDEAMLDPTEDVDESGGGAEVVTTTLPP